MSVFKACMPAIRHTCIAIGDIVDLMDDDFDALVKLRTLLTTLGGDFMALPGNERAIFAAAIARRAAYWRESAPRRVGGIPPTLKSQHILRLVVDNPNPTA
jgi:hypothetical protein